MSNGCQYILSYLIIEETVQPTECVKILRGEGCSSYKASIDWLLMCVKWKPFQGYSLGSICWLIDWLMDRKIISNDFDIHFFFFHTKKH